MILKTDLVLFPFLISGIILNASAMVEKILLTNYNADNYLLLI